GGGGGGGGGGWVSGFRVAVLSVRVTSGDGTEGPGRKAASLTWVHGARGAAPATRCLIGCPRLRGCGRSVLLGRPPGSYGRSRRQRTGGLQELAAVVPHRGSVAAGVPARGSGVSSAWPPSDVGAVRRREARRGGARPGCGRPAGRSCGPPTGRRACRSCGPSPGRGSRGREPACGRGSCRPHTPPSATPAAPAETAARAGPCGTGEGTVTSSPVNPTALAR